MLSAQRAAVPLRSHTLCSDEMQMHIHEASLLDRRAKSLGFADYAWAVRKTASMRGVAAIVRYR